MNPYSAGLESASIWLFRLIFAIVFALWAFRWLLPMRHVPFTNPLCQMIYGITAPVMRTIKPWIRPIGNIETSAVLLMLLTVVGEWVIWWLWQGQRPASPVGWVMLIISACVHRLLWLYLLMMFCVAIASWVGQQRNPWCDAFMRLIHPIIRPLMGKLTIGQMDFSFMLVSLALLLIDWVLVAPTMVAAMGW